MKILNYLLLVFILTSCGNPHLKKIDDIGFTATPISANPADLDAGTIKTDDGLSLKTEEPKVTGEVSVQNLDVEKGWTVKYSFEKGEHFRIVGGDCTEELKASATCTVVVEFFSDDVGIFVDNLKITYSRIDNPQDTKVIMYPLRGERLAKVLPKDSVVVMKSVSQSDQLDFGRTTVKELPTGKVIVTNIGESEVALDFSFGPLSKFNFTSGTFPGTEGTCGQKLKAKESCYLDIAFKGEKAGVYQDSLILKYDDLLTNKTKTTTFPILGEKISSLDDCQGTPCGTPYTRGPLTASEVFSKNVDFGRVSVGLQVKKQVEILNLGTTSYKLKDVLIKNNEVFSFSGGKYPGLTGTCGDVILPGSCVIELSYVPKAVGHDEGEFTLTTVEGDKLNLTLVGDGDAVKKCEDYNEVLVNPEKDYLASSVIFPYFTSKAGTSAKLATLYGQKVNSYVKGIKSYTVKNGMVYVTFKLPKLEGEIINMNFGVNVSKVILDAHKDTEMLCLSTKGVRKCSGHEFTLSSWQKLKNPQFWDQFNYPVSEDYEANFASNEKKCGPYKCMDLKTQYELFDIFELTKDELEVIRKDGTITLIFSDDTRMLKMPRIAVKTKVVKDCH